MPRTLSYGTETVSTIVTSILSFKKSLILAAVSSPIKEAPITTSFLELVQLVFNAFTSVKSLSVNTFFAFVPSTGILLADPPVAINSLS